MTGLGQRLRRAFFASPFDAALTLMLVIAAWWALPPLFDWAITNAVVEVADSEACRAASGACWAVIGEKHRVMLFGTYPAAEQWRGWLLSAIIAGLALASARRSWWRPGLAVAWVVGIAAALTLQLGGVGGLARVPTANWGGLPLTLLLFLGTVTVGLPLATVLALARRSSYPVIRMLAIGYIEVVRGVPLVNILFVASLMFPLFMPPGVDIDKLLRAQVGMILFFAAYTAETLRGGLQAIPRGQYEAADALGLGYWRRTRAIVLPQAFRVALPALLNDLIRAFKNTSVLVVIGLLDVLGGTMAALEDPFWTRHYVEAYLCVASLYLVICFALARQSQRLERELARGRDG